MQNAPQLRILSAKANRIYRLDCGPLPALTDLDLSANSLCSFDALAMLKEAAPALHFVNVSWNPFREGIVGQSVLCTELRSTLAESVREIVCQEILPHSLDGQCNCHESKALVIPCSSSAPAAIFTYPWSRNVVSVAAKELETVNAASLTRLQQDKAVLANAYGVIVVGDQGTELVPLLLETKPSQLTWLYLEQQQLLAQRPEEMPLRTALQNVAASLTELSLCGSMLHSLEPILTLTQLRRLDLSRNRLTSLEGLSQLSWLQDLCLSCNFIADLRPLADLDQLQHLYLAQNAITRPRSLLPLRALGRLHVLDVLGNPIAQRKSLRAFVLYYFGQQLAILNREAVSADEVERAQRKFSGVLTVDALADVVGEEALPGIRALDLPRQGYFDVRLRGELNFHALHSLNLEDNFLTSLEPLAHLPALRVLCLTGNRVRSFVAATNPVRPPAGTGHTMGHGGASGVERTTSSRFGSNSSLHASVAGDAARASSARRTAAISAALSQSPPNSPSHLSRNHSPGSTSVSGSQLSVGASTGGGSSNPRARSAEVRNRDNVLLAARQERQANMLATLRAAADAAATTATAATAHGMDAHESSASALVLSSSAALPVTYTASSPPHLVRAGSSGSLGGGVGLQNFDLAPRSATRFPQLEVLMLTANGITSLEPLELASFPRLRALFLDDNDIGSTHGLCGLPSLEVLVLDRNRVKFLEPHTLGTCPKLSEIHLSGNRLHDMEGLRTCSALRRLVVESNRLSEPPSLLPLTYLPNLQELVIAGNAVVRRPESRLRIVQLFPRLTSLDLVPITAEERVQAAELLAATLEDAGNQGSSPATMAATMASAEWTSVLAGLSDRIDSNHVSQSLYALPSATAVSGAAASSGSSSSHASPLRTSVRIMVSLCRRSSAQVVVSMKTSAIS